MPERTTFDQAGDERLRMALVAGRMGIWEWDVAGARVIWSAMVEELHGIPIGSFEGTLEAYQRDIHPEDRDRVLASIQALVSGAREEHLVQYRICRPDGDVRWLEGHGQAERDASGTLRRVVGVCMDITDRKRLELEREQAHARNARLVTITAAIARAVSPQEVFTAVVDEVGSALGASSAGLWLLREDRRAVLVHAYGYAPQARAGISGRPIDAEREMPILDALREGRPLWIESQRELLATYPHLAGFVSPEREYRVCCLPVLGGGEVIGAVGFTFETAGSIEEDERHFLLLVAGYCSQALERLRLLDSERESRRRAELAAARLAVLSRASLAFSSGALDGVGTCRAIVDELNAEFADASGITLLWENDDALEVVAVGHRDAEGTALMHEMLAATPVKAGAGITGTVAATGRPVLLPHVDPATFEIPAYAGYREFFARWMPRSVLAVPLRAGGRILGTLSAVRGGDAPPFSEGDLVLAQELAERAALAIEHSRLQETNREARERAELMYRLAAELIDARHSAELCETALDGLQRVLGATRASILTFDESGVMRFRAWRGLSTAYRDAVEGHSPWARDERAPEPIVVHDAEADPAYAEFQPVLRAEGIRTLVFIPLFAEGRLIGKLMVYYADAREVAPHEVQMARAIGNHVAAAFARFAAMEELERTVRFNDMFTGMLGHDLRNPLAAIVNAAQLVLLREDTPRIVKPLDRIVSAGTRMARMIDQLLDFTRIRVGSGIPLRVASLDVLAVLRQVVEELEAASPEWTVRIRDQGDTTGAWDGDRLSQVFSNLLGNALQHGQRDRGCTVLVDGTESDHLRVDVHNFGTIPSDVVPRLFDPMSSSDRRRDGPRGLGLGLFISQKITSAHGGRIEVRSTAGDGTTFTVVLPRASASEPRET